MAAGLWCVSPAAVCLYPSSYSQRLCLFLTVKNKNTDLHFQTEVWSEVKSSCWMIECDSWKCFRLVTIPVGLWMKPCWCWWMPTTNKQTNKSSLIGTPASCSFLEQRFTWWKEILPEMMSAGHPSPSIIPAGRGGNRALIGCCRIPPDDVTQHGGELLSDQLEKPLRWMSISCGCWSAFIWPWKLLL